MKVSAFPCEQGYQKAEAPRFHTDAVLVKWDLEWENTEYHMVQLRVPYYAGAEASDDLRLAPLLPPGQQRA